MVTHTITIDPDAIVSEMIDSYKNGNVNDTIKALANDHAGLTALFLTTGITEKRLTIGDVNTITNRLIDRRVDIAQNS